jgi:hypothetical protein
MEGDGGVSKLVRSEVQPTSEQEHFILGRVRPFMQQGLDRSLQSLLAEAYLQGLRDVLDAQEHRAGT